MVLQPVQHSAQLPDFAIAQATVFNQVLEERQRFAAEQPMDEVVNDLAKDLLWSHASHVNFGASLASRAQVAFRLQAPQVGLHGLEIETALGRQHLQHLPHAGLAQLPNELGDLKFRFGDGRPL